MHTSALMTWMKFREISPYGPISTYEAEIKQRTKEKIRRLQHSGLHTTYFRTNHSELQVSKRILNIMKSRVIRSLSQALVLDCIVLEAWIKVCADKALKKALDKLQERHDRATVT